MLKRFLYGSGAFGVLTAGYLLGSVSLTGVFAQTAPTTPTPARSQAKEQGEANEANESAALASQAKITADQAKTAALGQFAGATVNKTELESENGTVVYSVQLTESSGAKQDVKVDATSGKVVHTESDGPEGPEGPGGPESETNE
jgi:hypothetical protein